MFLQDNNPNPQVGVAFTDDNVLIVNPRHLPGVAVFEQLYLIGKILCETLPLKLITSKCLTEWKPTSDVNLLDMANGFHLIKFSNVLDRNAVLHGQPWFVGVQIFCL